MQKDRISTLAVEAIMTMGMNISRGDIPELMEHIDPGDVDAVYVRIHDIIKRWMSLHGVHM